MKIKKRENLEIKADSVHSFGKSSLSGDQRYDKLVKERPEILRDYLGKDIWIYPKTGDYAIGEGMLGLTELMKKVGTENAKDFYSRRIGKLETLPFFEK